MIKVNKSISISFFHGLGDCANFAHALPLWIDKGFSIEVECDPEKAALFKAAGAKIVTNAKVRHEYPHPPVSPYFSVSCSFDIPTYKDHHLGNKLAWNLDLPTMMPHIGNRAELWEELLKVKLNLDSFVTKDAKAKVDSYIESLPRPLILVHTRGNGGQESKNLNYEQELALYRGLIDKVEGSVILIDHENIAARMYNWRIRHLVDDWELLTVVELYYLISKADLLIGVDSGPLHLARFTDTKVIGLWTYHFPSNFVLPRSNSLNVVFQNCRESSLIKCRRLYYNIITCPGSSLDGSFIANLACKFLDNSASYCITNNLLGYCRYRGVNGYYVDRHLSFKKFFDLLPVNANVLETGCIRTSEDWTAGYSTYLLGIVLKEIGGHLTSVDIAENNLDFAKLICVDLPVSYVHSNSIDYLESYDGEKFDALYLDSADVGTPDYQEICLKEAQLGLPHLKDNGTILIDDTYWSNGSFDGKGVLAIPWLNTQGWNIYYAGYQVLLKKQNHNDKYK